MPMIFPYVDVLVVLLVQATALVSATEKCGDIAKAVSHKLLCTAGSQQDGAPSVT